MLGDFLAISFISETSNWNPLAEQLKLLLHGQQFVSCYFNELINKIGGRGIRWNGYQFINSDDLDLMEQIVDDSDHMEYQLIK